MRVGDTRHHDRFRKASWMHSALRRVDPPLLSEGRITRRHGSILPAAEPVIEPIRSLDKILKT